MQFPKREKNHIICSIAEKIFCIYMPEKWIIRDLAREDYGIDYYIEVVDDSYNVTGNTFLVQLKGKEHISFNDDKFRMQINSSTLNYWINLQVPVFLFVVDNSKAKIYQTSVKHIVRKNYSKIKEQKTFTFKLDRDSELRASKENFNLRLQSELHFEEDMLHLYYLLMNINEHFDSLYEAIGRDLFLPVEQNDIHTLMHLINITISLCRMTLVKDCKIKKIFKEATSQDHLDFGEDATMYERGRSSIAICILETWIETLPKLMEQKNEEKEYWQDGTRLYGSVLLFGFEKLYHDLNQKIEEAKSVILKKL